MNTINRKKKKKMDRLDYNALNKDARTFRKIVKNDEWEQFLLVIRGGTVIKLNKIIAF